jgi:hypothetical protein
MKWGGDPLRTNGNMCDKALTYMSTALETLSIAEPSLDLIVPETLIGGRLYDLYREYTLEQWVDRKDSVLTLKRDKPMSSVYIDNNGGGGSSAMTTQVAAANRTNNNKNNHVCFLVRTYDNREALKKSTYIDYGLPTLIHCKYILCVACRVFFVSSIRVSANNTIRYNPLPSIFTPDGYH